MTLDNRATSRSVLVALDGSAASTTAIPAAQAVAQQLGARLEILFIYGPGELIPDIDVLVPADTGGQPPTELRTVEGDPTAAILEAVEDPSVTMVVLTTHGREVEPESRLGHVATAVISRSIDPVLLIRPEATSASTAPISSLLVPLDGTPATTEALVPAIALADELHAAVDLLYVAHGRVPDLVEAGSIGAPRYVDQAQHEWPAWAGEVLAHVRASCGELPSGIVPRVFLSSGNIGDAIARFADEHHEDAVVLVRRSRFEPNRARILRAVLDLTPCPVLLLGKP